MNLKTYLKSCNQVYHVTIDPKENGVCRIHLVPPKKPKPNTPWLVILNGYSVIPLQSSWAILLKVFCEKMQPYHGQVLEAIDIESIKEEIYKEIKVIFNDPDKDTVMKDIEDMLTTFKAVSRGRQPNAEIGYLPLAKYAKYMKAPHRMDLMLSAMTKRGCWNCNQHCLHCYAANERMSDVEELNTTEWKQAIDKLKEACIPSITFTGGEATLRSDLVELVEYSKWFVTRLNTNGIKLDKNLCKALYDASLDSVQVTLYSYDEEIHNKLVGGNHFKDTIQGIKNALEAGLDVSINTPLCSLNKDYVKTVEFAHSLGVRYFSCSGLIPTGGAQTEESIITRLSNKEITNVVIEAYKYVIKYSLEISFTSPGWISKTVLKEMNMVVPSCGACLSNMAIAPNGDVIPCQSWLNGTKLGNINKLEWKAIWDNKTCKEIRSRAIKETQVCLLKETK